MQELKGVADSRSNGWACAAICTGACWMPCSAGAATGPAALAVVSGSFYYASYKAN